MYEIQVSWVGLTGLPGVSTFYTVATPATAPAELLSFFTAIRGLFPDGLTWTIPNSGDQIDSTNGQLLGSWSASGGGSVNSNGGAGGYAAGVGAYVNWRTNGVVNGRRIKGRTFLLPLLAAAYEVNGTLGSSALSTLQTAVNTLAGAAQGVGIWHRPVNGSGGSLAPVASGVVPDQVTSLRTRRR